ncbi:MAG: hypothetical protein K2K39_02025 [Clostridia bacterium]|nr:hypothetical protein [Clostridia bacterium]
MMGDKNLSLKQITHSKLFMLIGAVCAAAVDLLIIIMLAVGGGRDTHYVYPALMLALDIGYLIIGLCFTDYRFKYSLYVWISYVVLYGVLTAAGLGTILGGSGTVITAAAIWLWSLVHITLIICAIVAALCASRLVKNFWVACVFGVLGVLFLAGYAAFIGIFGFYGQGLEGRPLVYFYDNTVDSYTVEDVLAGRSGKVVVPETFNGKPVSAVNLKVFAKAGVKEYALPENVVFTGSSALRRNLNFSGKQIRVDKKAVNETRNKFLAFAEDTTAEGRGNVLALANATLPVNLDDGEGYVAFNYSEEAFKACGGEVIPVYVGALEEFNADTYAASFDYVARRDAESIANLDAAYSGSGYILSDIAGEKGSVFGGVSSNTVGWVNFDKVYRVNVLSGNDDKYDMRAKQPDFCSDELDGSSLGYRYVTGSKASAFLAGATPRKGFNLQWVVMADGGSTDISDLATVLDNLKESQVTLVPVWSLKAPVVTVSSDKVGNTLTYGESVSLSSQVVTEAEGVSLAYQWSFGENLPESWRESGLELALPLPAESGVYSLKVIAGGDSVTSLTAESSAQISIQVEKKKIALNWSVPEDRVFDGNQKTVSVGYDRAQLVSDDNITLSINAVGSDWTTFVNAGTYNIEATASGDENYELIGKTYAFNLLKRPVAVDWSGFENLLYTGEIQAPTASALGLSGESLVQSVANGKKDAGESYTATAICGNGNYEFSNPTQKFSIKKVPLTVTPQVRFTYGSSPDASSIKLICEGFVNGETQAVLGGSIAVTVNETKAGTYEDGAIISGLTSNNYEITYQRGTLIIDKLTAEIGWVISGWGMVYNGEEQCPAALVNNAVNGDTVSVVTEVEGGSAINAGEYTARAVRLEGKDAGNYILPEGITHDYKIEKRTATVVWDSPQSAVYTGEVYYTSYTIKNLAEDDYKHFNYEVTGASDAGTFIDFVQYKDAESREFIGRNYNLINPTSSFTIEKAESELHIFVNGVEISGAEYEGRVGDRISWTANATVTLTVNGTTFQNDSRFTAGHAGIYNFVFELADKNHKSKTVTLKFIA